VTVSQLVTTAFLSTSWGPVLIGAVVTALIVGLVVYWLGGNQGVGAPPAAGAAQAAGRPPGPLVTMLLGQDGRASTSKTTAAAWTVIVVFLLASILTRALAVNTNLDQQFTDLGDSYLLLVGGPFAALVLAKGITVSRIKSGSLTKSVQAPAYSASDLASDDGGKTDVVDVQFLMFNLLTMIYVVAAFLWRPESGLPALPTALAALTSVSALTYTANKAVTASGPAITGASFDPLRGTVTVTGVNLLGSPGLPSAVTFDNINVEPQAGASSSSVTFPSPADTQPGPHTVVVSAPTPSGGVMQAAATVATS
jgi:hypothetical protein